MLWTRGIALLFPGNPRSVPQCVAMPALEQTTPFMRRAERRMVNNQLGELLDREELFIVERIAGNGMMI